MYQYLKLIAIVVMLVCLAVRCSLMFLSWALVFGYLLLDDIAQVHESAGWIVSDTFALSTWAADRAGDVGELIFAGLVATGFLILLAIPYRMGPESFRQVSRRLALLIGLLAVFGVGMDFLHGLLMNQGAWVDWWMAVIEDGGEMVILSLVVWYCYTLQNRSAESAIWSLGPVGVERSGSPPIQAVLADKAAPKSGRG